VSERVQVIPSPRRRHFKEVMRVQCTTESSSDRAWDKCPWFGTESLERVREEGDGNQPGKAMKVIREVAEFLCLS
jgi:hypothetical protein